MNYTEKMINFYEECKKNGFTKFDDEYCAQKAYLLAKNMGLSTTESEIGDLFKKAEEIKNKYVLAEKEKKEKEKFEQAREEDKQLKEDLLRYSEVKGRNKVITILTDELNEYQEAYDRLNNLSRNYYRSMSMKEKDWATHGGIASGIAGPAAGLATALHVQNQNASIRSYNQGVMQVASYIEDASAGKLSTLSAKIERLKQKIEKAKYLYESKEQDILKYLRFDKLRIQKTQGNSLRYELDCWIIPNSIKMNSNVKLVVDGSLYADLVDIGKKEVISTVCFVIPKDGVKNNGASAKLEGIDLNPKKLEFDLENTMINFDRQRSDLVIVESMTDYSKEKKSDDRCAILDSKIEEYYSGNEKELNKLDDEKETLLLLLERYKTNLDVKNLAFYNRYLEYKRDLDDSKNKDVFITDILAQELLDLEKQMEAIVQYYDDDYKNCLRELERNRSLREGRYSILKG